MKLMLPRLFFSFSQCAFGAILALGIGALPSRHIEVDFPLGLIAGALLLSGVLTAFGTQVGYIGAKILSVILLLFGLILIALFATSLTVLAAVYGPIGKGGTALFLMLIGLVFPYFIVYPSFLLVKLKRDTNTKSALKFAASQLETKR